MSFSSFLIISPKSLEFITISPSLSTMALSSVFMLISVSVAVRVKLLFLADIFIPSSICIVVL